MTRTSEIRRRLDALEARRLKPTARKGTKQARVIAMLSRQHGATRHRPPRRHSTRRN
jgi:hypothetical protein